MPRKPKPFDPKKLAYSKVEYLCYTDLPLSNDAGEAISNASNITFGDSMHSLHKASKLRKVLTDHGDLDEDVAILDALIDLHGTDTLIDMES